MDGLYLVFIAKEKQGCWYLLVVSQRSSTYLALYLVLKMASPYPFTITREQFNTFHRIDRELYTILVINLWRDPVESMQVSALWLWLERVGFDNIVNKMLSLPMILINELADEAVICLNCVNTGQIPSSAEGCDIHLIQGLMKKEISLQFFLENRLLATQGVTKVVSEVCIRVLFDIMQIAVERNAAQSIADCQRAMQQSFQQPLVHPGSGFPPMGFGPNEGGQASNQQTAVPVEERTMFVTFCKDYPVSEREVREYFFIIYGDCTESLHMQEVNGNEQSLFARIVFQSVSTMNAVLNGAGKVKFSINGKHVWAWKLVLKHPRASLPPLRAMLPMLRTPFPGPFGL